MKKVILTFGSIAGLIVGTFMFVSMLIFGCSSESDMSKGMIIGYAAMLIAFSFVFVGIKNYRDKQLGGTITFGKAFLTGLGITFIASTIYVIIWRIEHTFFMPDFFQKYMAAEMKNFEASGATAAAIEAKRAEMAHMGELYKNPIMFVLFTYMEILPVGLLVSLISAAILRKRGTTVSAG